MQESLTAVVTSHRNDDGLLHVLGNLRYQTRPPDEYIVVVSDAEDYSRLARDVVAVVGHSCGGRLLESPNLEDWGHEKRSVGLGLASRTWVGFFNDDDSYHPQYIEKMMSAGEGYDVAFCRWTGVPECRFVWGSSTSGNFIVKTGLARKVGYVGRQYDADGQFINDLVEAGAFVAPRVNEILYAHNRQPWPL